jgi:hypothetical protein
MKLIKNFMNHRVLPLCILFYFINVSTHKQFFSLSSHSVAHKLFVLVTHLFCLLLQRNFSYFSSQKKLFLFISENLHFHLAEKNQLSQYGETSFSLNFIILITRCETKKISHSANKCEAAKLIRNENTQKI